MRLAPVLLALTLADMTAGQSRDTPVLKARPATFRISGLVVAIDAEKAEIAIRDYRGTRRTFDVEGRGRRAFASLSPGDAIVVTCLEREGEQVAVDIEIVPI